MDSRGGLNPAPLPPTTSPGKGHSQTPSQQQLHLLRHLGIRAARPGWMRRFCVPGGAGQGTESCWVLGAGCGEGPMGPGLWEAGVWGRICVPRSGQSLPLLRSVRGRRGESKVPFPMYLVMEETSLHTLGGGGVSHLCTQAQRQARRRWTHSPSPARGSGCSGGGLETRAMLPCRGKGVGGQPVGKRGVACPSTLPPMLTGHNPCLVIARALPLSPSPRTAGTLVPPCGSPGRMLDTEGIAVVVGHSGQGQGGLGVHLAQPCTCQGGHCAITLSHPNPRLLGLHPPELPTKNTLHLHPPPWSPHSPLLPYSLPCLMRSELCTHTGPPSQGTLCPPLSQEDPLPRPPDPPH